MNTKYTIDELLDEVVSLPSLPGTVAHIMRLVADPQCSLAVVAKAISADPPLALKTLRLVNTAYYGLRQKVSTIEHAVVLLGTNVIKNLAFTATVFDMMKGGVEDFFRHSVMCAVAVRVLEEASAESPNSSAEEAFVYGLLHDIGKVIFQQFLPEESEAVLRLVTEKRIPWHQAETEVMGVDHAQVGARIATNWKLGDALVNGIAGHHLLARCEERYYPIAARVAIADYICTQCGVNTPKNYIVNISDEQWQLVGLDSARLPQVMDTFFDRLSVVEELIQIAL